MKGERTNGKSGKPINGERRQERLRQLKISRAGLAPTKTGKPQAPRRSLPCRRLPGHPPKTSRAGLAPTKSGESPKPLVGACPAGDWPGIPPKISRAGLAPTKSGGSPKPLVGACPSGDCPGIPPPNLASRARSYENPKTLRRRATTAFDFHIPSPSPSVFASLWCVSPAAQRHPTKLPPPPAIRR